MPPIFERPAPLMVWASDPKTPHDQYILDISGPPLLRFLPFKFRSEAQLKTFVSERRRQLIRQVPGYCIALAAEWLNEHTMKWEPLLAATFTAHLLKDDPHVPAFYISHKIDPNGQKFNRYRID